MSRAPLIILLLLLAGPIVRAGELTVATAISLKESMTAIAPEFKKQTGLSINFLFGSSGQLQAQIKAGAPVDVFISAANDQVDALNDAGLIDVTTRRIVARNALVLIVPPASKIAVNRFEDLAKPDVKRLAIGQPQTVPAGHYAQQCLEHLGLFEPLHDRLVMGSNVRQVLDYVVRGEASAGIVYASDAQEAGQTVKVVATAAASWHEPIVYPAVVLKRTSDAADAKHFIDFLTGQTSQQILTTHGLLLPETAATRP